MGFAASVITTVPIIRNLTFCMAVPAAVYLAMYIHFRISDGVYKIKFNQSIFMGVITGLSAAVFTTIFETLITYFAKSNDFAIFFPELEKTYRVILPPGAELEKLMSMFKNAVIEINTKGFSAFYTFLSAIGYVITNFIMGVLGGILSTVYFHKKLNNQNNQ